MSARLLSRTRVLAALVGLAAAIAAGPATARAEVATVTGGESSLLINFTTVLHLQESNIYTTVLPPATISGMTFSIYFPMTGGIFDTSSMLGSVNHAGSLLLLKYNADQTVVEKQLESANLKIVNGNTLVGDAFGVVPSPSADLVNTQITPGPGGTVKYQADVNVASVTATVLNTYFETDAFTPGLNLGRLTAYIETVRYPRPGGASPLNVPLVPAFAPCSAPDVSHVQPLDAGSCSSPSLASSILTTSSTGVGTGNARLRVIPGNPLTAEDEADMAIDFSATDVRESSNGSDYVGRVALRSTLRATDMASGGAAGRSGTVQDFPFGVAAPCHATPDPSGSTCSLSTTIDTILPGFAREGERAVLALRDVSLMDPGPDRQIPVVDCPPSCGSGDERPFLVQGVFAP